MANLGNWGSDGSQTGPLPVAQSTGKMYDPSLVALTPQFAAINASTNGNNTLVAAVAGKIIRVLAYNLIAQGTVTATFQDGAGGTAISGPKALVANSGLVAPFSPTGWFQTSAGNLLNVSLNAGVIIGGELVYVTV